MLAYRSVDRSRLGGFRELVDGRSWWVRRVENTIRWLCVLDDGEGDEESETKEEATSRGADGGKSGAASEKNGSEGNRKAAVSEDSPLSERDGARAEREPQDA